MLAHSKHLIFFFNESMNDVLCCPPFGILQMVKTTLFSMALELA